MNRNSKLSNYIFPFLMLGFSIFCTFFYPSGLQPNMSKIYMVLVISSWIYTIILFIVFMSHNFDLLDPYVFVSGLHILIYLVAPIRSIFANDIVNKIGINTFGGAIKGTVIATITFMALTLAYYSRPLTKKSYSITQFSHSSKRLNKNNVLLFSWIIWGIGFAASILYLYIRGMSLSYILSLGTSGNFNDDLALNSAYAFLSVIGNFMFGSWLAIYYYSKERISVWVSFIVFLLTLIIRGFRIYIVILLCSPLVFYFIKNKKRPKMSTIILSFIIFAFMVGIVGWSRGALRTNGSLALSDFKLEMITDAILGNFDIYKTYYAVVEHIPNELDYTGGKQMFMYTIIMFIPRALWASKPQPVLRDVIRISLNEVAVIGGAAYPALGEWYHEFGVLGSIVIAFISGRLLNRLKSFSNSNSIIDIMIYSVLFPSLLQTVIRGYTPSNFWMIITLVIPAIVIRHFCGDEIICSDQSERNMVKRAD